VEVLIYVFDVVGKEFEKDLKHYKNCLEALEEFSKDAKIFCLVHKMDLLAEGKREKIFEQKKTEIVDCSDHF
jgi:Ras-related GTP-binding protein A/B